MKKIINWFVGLLKDEKGVPSSKRFIGIVSGLTLCLVLVINTYSHGDIKPSDAIVNAVTMLTFGALGLASVDKFSGKK